MKKHFIIPPLCLLLNACELLNIGPDPKPQLPPITQEGKNTFGCLVNGEVWLPKPRNGTPSVFAELGFDYGIINAYNSSNSEDLQLIIYDSANNLQTGIRYRIINDEDYSFANYDRKNSGVSCKYTKDNILDGSIILSTIDRNKRILAGEFEFSTYKADCGDTIKITQGRFDIGEVYY